MQPKPQHPQPKPPHPRPMKLLLPPKPHLLPLLLQTTMPNMQSMPKRVRLLLNNIG